MTDVHIVSTYFAEDGRATGAPAHWLDGAGLEVADLDVRTLRIKSLGDGWAPDDDENFGSGAAPIFALKRALELISEGAQIVRIVGRDLLRTGYRTQERRQLMGIYECSIPEGYTRVAKAFMEHHDIDRETFLELARALEANCRETARERGLAIDPPGTHDLFVTELFRRVDCAHPVIDFEAEVVLAPSSVALKLGLSGPRVTAVATAQIEDGPANAAEIARYAHLRDVIDAVAEQRGPLPTPLRSGLHSGSLRSDSLRSGPRQPDSLQSSVPQPDSLRSDSQQSESPPSGPPQANSRRSDSRKSVELRSGPPQAKARRSDSQQSESPRSGPPRSEYALELYTCFPVVPLAFLVAAGWATTPAQMTTFLRERAVTVSGGMNFARAPWNNPALRGLAMVARQVEARQCIGLVHGNGGLGAKQGLCVVEP